MRFSSWEIQPVRAQEFRPDFWRRLDLREIERPISHYRSTAISRRGRDGAINRRLRGGAGFGHGRGISRIPAQRRLWRRDNDSLRNRHFAAPPVPSIFIYIARPARDATSGRILVHPADLCICPGGMDTSILDILSPGTPIKIRDIEIALPVYPSRLTSLGWKHTPPNLHRETHSLLKG